MEGRGWGMRFKHGVIILLTFLMMFSVFYGYAVQSTSPDPPIHIHLTWQRNDTAHTITITWKTRNAESGDKVLYDVEPHNGDPSKYRFSATGSHHTYPGAGGYIHDVELTGLSPNTTYYFICGGPVGGWSEEKAFRTAPETECDFRFIIGADSRTNHAERDKITQVIMIFNPSFIINIGDIVENGSQQYLWDNWFDHMDKYFTAANGLTVPLIPVLGNHERNATNFYEQFALPNNEQWFSIDWANVHIIVLNSEADEEGLRAQQQWLEKDLSNCSKKWKIAVFHRNVFTSDHDQWTPAFEYFVPLFDKYHVQLVVNGHSHNYMRTKPINWTASPYSYQPSYSNGTMYIVSGGWGAPLKDVVQGWWTAYTVKKYNFLLLSVYQNGTLHIEAKDDRGVTFDEVWLGSPSKEIIFSEPSSPAGGMDTTLLVTVTSVIVLITAVSIIIILRRRAR